MGRVAVILHERLGNWSGQLRRRLADRPIRWFETRSAADLAGVLDGLAAPVVLIDLGRQLVQGLSDLTMVRDRCSDAFVLVLDPDANEDVPDLARELGATRVISGFVPPPDVANLIDRWIGLSSRAIDRGEWTRPLTANLSLGPEEWLESILAEGQRAGPRAGGAISPARPAVAPGDLAVSREPT